MKGLTQKVARLEELAIGVEGYTKNASESLIHVGRLLCDAREEFTANKEFGAWREERLPWLESKLAERWMNAYKNGGENLLRHNVGTTAIYQLTAPSVPESAREEALEKAENGETLTVKQAKEITTLHKDIEKLKKAEKELLPNLENLIPGLARLHNSGSLPRATALEFSKLDHSIQRNVVLPKFEAEQRLQKHIDILKKEKAHALERESQAREEKDSLQANYDSAVEQGAQSVIAEKEKDIQRKIKEMDQLKVDLRDEIERTQGEAIERRVREEYESKIGAERKAKEQAERQLKDNRELSRERSAELVTLEKDNEQLKARLELSDATTVDNSRARSMADVKTSFEVQIRGITQDQIEHGTTMEASISVVVEIARIAAMFVEEQAGQTIIDI